MIDVLVVGGGPVGVMMGILSARRGLSVLVLEKTTEIYDLPRAIVMDDEIQRVFQNLGLLEELLTILTPIKGAEFVTADGEQIMGIELDPHASYPLGHHPNMTYYQPQLEAFIRAAAIQAGVDLRLGVEMVSMEETDGHMVVTTNGPDGQQQHEARWVVGADGASSPTRKLLDIPFVSQGFDQDWLVIDLELRRRVDTLPRFVQQICDPVRPTTFVVGHADYRRWEFQLQEGETRDEMLEPDRIWALLDGWVTRDDAELIRAVVYRFHATVAERMQQGRVFLAGDSAHQMPPFLGQGLCSGIRDAAGLAWRLQLAKQGLAGNPLLETYGAERLPHAAGVVAHAVDTGRLIDQLAGRETEEVGLDSAYGGSRPMPHVQRGLVRGEAHAVGRQLPQPMVEDRRLDELLGDGFAVLLTNAADCPVDVMEAWADIGGRLVELPADTLPHVLPPGGAVVVRPDRYVAAVAQDSAELTALTADLMATLRAK